MKIGGEEMPNGELRFRFTAPDGTGYILTQGVGDSGWQNAHYHCGVRETWCVQSGEVIFAWEDQDGKRHVKKYGPGDVISSEPLVPHNMALFGGAVTHCTKHGVAVGNPDKNGADWYPASEEFDSWTKSLTFADVTY